MKKFSLFLVAITMSLFSFAAQPKRIYAYDLSSALVDKVYTFSFTANETPTSGKIIFYDATSSELVGEIALTNPVLGKNEVEIAEYSLPGNDGQQLNWSVELSAAEVTAYEKVFADASHRYRRGYSNVDVSPESDHFGKVYVADRTSTKNKSKFYVYNPTYAILDANGHTLGATTWGFGRFTIASDGTVWLTDYTDGHSGLFLVDPDILTTTSQFFTGTRASSGLFKNGSVEVGSSLSCASLYGKGANTKLVTVAEDYTGTSFPVAVFNVGKSDGTLATTWTTAPNILFNTLGNGAQIFDIKACEQGVWVATNRSNGGNSKDATSLRFYTWEGNCTWSSHEHTDLINGSLGGSLAITPDEKQIIMKIQDNTIAIFDVTWSGNTPTLTLNASFNCGYAAVSAINLDYAGNIVTIAGTAFSGTDTQRMSLVVYSNPTTKNTCEVPAKKADVVTKVEAAVTLYTITTNVNDPIMGSVSGNLGTYEDGATAELTAVANEHYEFVNWTGDVTSTDNPLTIPVDGDKNITANFAKKQYTLTVFVNDENKGTIDVATGSYEYGTEVTLTATPKPDYKLLAWSNKATTESITVTMDNNKAVSAYFVKEYAADPTFTIEKVWENTHVPSSTSNGYQAVGWDGTIYMQDAGNKKILTYSDADDTGTEYVTSSGAGQQIAVDEVGNLIVFNATFYAANPNAIIIYPNGSTTGTPVSFTLDAPGRCDFLTASGNIYSAEGGYVYFFCKDQKTISRLFIKNGAATAEDVTDDTIANITNAAASQSNVVLDIYGNIHTQSKNAGAFEYNITTLTSTADPYLAKKNSTIGGCTFELGGKEFWAYVAGTTAYSSEWQLINATDGKLVSEEILFAKDKTSTNSAANWLNVQVVDEKTAYIYQFCPTVAAAVWKVSFKENYTVSATANPVVGGTVTGADTYQEGATATLTATPNTGYKFVNWTTGGVEVSTEATYSFPVTENVELVANFEAITSKDPRAWAYDMKLGEEGDNYTFTFKATTAGQATITFNDKDGNALAQPESQTMEAVVGENKFTIAKNAFAAGVDAFWSITMDGAPIEGVVEVTDQTRGIYDFYNMMGVVVDNNTDSKDFGKIYVQASLNGKTDGITDRADNQKAGIFIYNQELNELNSPSNVGCKPTLPNGYDEIGSSYSTFQRLNIDPKTGNLVFSHAVSGNPAVFAINREDMTGDVTNLLTGVADMTRSVAHCFDVDGTLFVMNFADNKGTIYKVINGEATKFTETSNRFINANITITSDGRGGFWVSQNRGQIDYYYQLVHVTSEGAIDWSIYDDLGTYVAAKDDNPGKLGTSSLGWLGSSSRGALAYDAERNILAQGRNGKVELYTVSYDPTITLTPLHTIASNDLGTNIDGLAFDYAGDLYVVNSSKEKFQKFTLPTAENICTVAAPALEAVRFTPVYTVSVASNNNEWGIANGGGTFEENQNATITAVAATNYEFVNWTKEGAEVSTENPYTFAVTETATYVANFVEITKYTINVTYDNIMGTVTGDGSYYEGTEVTLTATAKGGYVFVNWSDGNTDETRTFTAGVDMPETLTANFKVAVPRAWAYDLRKGEDGENYTFTFKTTSAGTATLIFKDKDGNTLDFGAYTATATAAEEKTIQIAKTVFETATKDIYWEVELAGDAIAKMAEITNPTKGIYDIVAPQGIAVDNNTDSKHFGQVYVAAATDGTVSRGAQTRGIFVYDPILNELNSPNAGYLPANAILTNTTRQAIHRVAVNPTNNQVAFAYNISGSSAIWSMNPENLAGDAVDLIEGAGITKANSLCFDEAGSLYVMDNANTSTGGNIYKIKDGEADVFAVAQTGYYWGVEENAMTPDGRGGLWIAQNRWQVDGYPALSHVDKNGNVDFAVTSSSPEALKALFPHDDNNASYRGQCAYYAAEDILAFGGNKEAVLFKVTYDINNVPTNLEKLMSTGKLGTNIDGLAFDYAGDLYVASETTHRMYKFVIPTVDNTCTVPAPESQVIQKETRYTVTVAVNDNAMGTASNGGEYTAGETITLTATAKDGYRFINWTKGAEVLSAETSFTYTVPAENVTIVANFEALPTITYELNGGVWNKYGWTSKKDMYNALLDDWRAYSGSTRTNVSYEEQLGIGNSSKGIPTTITSVDDRVAFWNLFADATYAPKWGWLATYVDAVAATQYKKMDVAQGVKTQPTSAAGVFTFTIGNFFGEDNAHAADYIDAVDFTGEEAHITAFAPYWGQTFPMPTQPTEEVVLNAPYKEGNEFGGWYTTSDFSGAEITVVDENTDGTLYAKWIESVITVTIDDGPNNTAVLAPHDGETVTVNVNRNFGEDKILTLTLPFDMSATQISTYFGNATIYEFYNVVDAGEELHLQFYRTTSIEAGKPYILQTTSGYDAVDGFTIEGVTITTALSPVEIDGITMMPVLDGDGQLNQSTEYYLSNNALYCAGTYPQSLLGLRAYFTSPSPTPIRARVVFGENEATSIPMVTTPETKAQKIIQDGRLIIIRGEHQYNAQGQIIE